MADNERQPVTEERLQEIEAAGGLGRLSDSLENAIVLDLVAEIRRLRGRE
jgi:hypothetical protein